MKNYENRQNVEFRVQLNITLHYKQGILHIYTWRDVRTRYETKRRNETDEGNIKTQKKIAFKLYTKIDLREVKGKQSFWPLTLTCFNCRQQNEKAAAAHKHIESRSRTVFFWKLLFFIENYSSLFFFSYYFCCCCYAPNFCQSLQINIRSFAQTINIHTQTIYSANMLQFHTFYSFRSITRNWLSIRVFCFCFYVSFFLFGNSFDSTRR